LTFFEAKAFGSEQGKGSMMKRKFAAYSTLVAVVTAAILVVAIMSVEAGGGPPPRDADGKRLRPEIYVTSQGLIYESIRGPELPPNGPFQQLFPPGANPDYPALTYLSTEFGPGDPGYVGGRWWVDRDPNTDDPWVDLNDNGMIDDNEPGDLYFSCPLLPPGYPPAS
jgi:hypothetical protein